MTDTLLLIGRVLIAPMFLMAVWFGSPNVGYLTSINFISPDVMSPLARVVEWGIVISLVLGLGTRYGALLGLLFVVIAMIAAHRWWAIRKRRNWCSTRSSPRTSPLPAGLSCCS
jgi:putative oxidoreductase